MPTVDRARFARTSRTSARAAEPHIEHSLPFGTDAPLRLIRRQATGGGRGQKLSASLTSVRIAEPVPPLGV
ncbi:hypothetical protein GA0115259_106513 [Streptomyces sp. MnatMP-M17]|nr:hypothetical protein GA0115259_106513 [Streptomyces sp. MnatMP-M17]